MRLRIPREPLGRLRVRCKMAGEIRTNLVAARADARTDGGDNIFRIGSKPRCQGLDGDHGCACRGALPACVNGRNRSGSAIGEQNRHAVGCSYADGDGRVVADGDICFGPLVVRKGREAVFRLPFALRTRRRSAPDACARENRARRPGYSPDPASVSCHPRERLRVPARAC